MMHPHPQQSMWRHCNRLYRIRRQYDLSGACADAIFGSDGVDFTNFSVQ